MARYEGRTGGGSNHKKSMRQSNKDKVKIPKSMEVKRIIGHVEVEELWNLRCSLVGETTMVCSTNCIQSRLTEWGLGEIKVQWLGGKSFLLTIIDVELFLMLEDLGWSYIKEIFTNVELWSEKVSSKGSFEALGENVNHVLDCEKVIVLITTSITSKISEVVEVEVGNLSFLVRVEEKGFLDQPTKLPIGVSNLKKASEKIYQVEDSTSSTSLDISLTSSPLECEGADIIDALFELRSVLLCEVCRFSSLFLADSGGRCFVENLANELYSFGLPCGNVRLCGVVSAEDWSRSCSLRQVGGSDGAGFGM
ncbi:hypothetical protein V6N13_037644 [Hibiscus sabdariffa]